MTFKDLTIFKFQQINNAIESNPNSPTNQWYDILPIMTGREKKEFVLMPHLQLRKEIKKFEWLGSFEYSPTEWVKDFECGGEWFMLEQFATDWNTEQFISMSNLTKDRGSIIDNLHLILATLCYKEKGEQISLTEFDRRSVMFREKLNILTAYPIGFFFAVFLAKLSQTTQYYSHLKKKEKQITEMMRAKHLSVSGIGITQ